LHILLTDVLTCPRCGPRFGLILLANRVIDRRVHDGILGCSNCREKYPIRNGAGHLGAEPGLPVQVADDDALMRVAAMLGVTEGPGLVLLAGDAAAHAIALSDMIGGVEIVATDYGVPGGAHDRFSGDAGSAARPGINVIGVAPRSIPVAGGRVLAAALSGTAADELLEEGTRVVRSGGRLVLESPPENAVGRLEGAGMVVIARDATAIVATKL
jgi:uncharacterized protein YbaR (Trm112 family)